MITSAKPHVFAPFFLFFAIALASMPASSAQLALSDTPLFLTVSVPPNLVLTLDDSGSMRRAFVPEVCGDASDCAYLDNRYGKAAHNNALYYNPNITYTPPKNADGTSRLSSSNMTSTTNIFATAYRNGFDTAFGMVNLSSAYRPTTYLDFGSVTANTATEDYMNHYTSATGDVKCRSNKCQYTTNVGSTWSTMTSTSICNSDATCQTRTMPAYYHVFDSSNSGCTGTDAQKKEDNDCYDIKIVSSTSGPGGTDERQNFANWYAFYRTRNLATVSGASLAFAGLDPTYRVSWQALNSCRGSTTSLVDTDCDGWKNNFTGKNNAIKSFTGTHKNDFFDWLFQVPTDSGTPLREAMTRIGEYYKTSGENSPYDNDFTTAASGEYACRRNMHILMTDGIWNDSGFTGPGNVDHTGVTLPDGKSYTAAAPYNDSYSNTLADVAFKYWSADLRTLTDNLTPSIKDISGSEDVQYFNPKNDPATWQHMTNYTIGLGLTAFLADSGLTWSGNMYTGSYPNILAGTTLWPGADLAMGSAGATYGHSAHDLWHAAINSRGKFFSAESPDDLSNAFSAILTAISSANSSSAAAAANSTSVQAGTVIYQAQFNSQNWSGHLYNFNVNNDGAVIDLNGDGKLDGLDANWDAATLIPAPASRTIKTINGGTGVEFIWANLSASQQTALQTQDRLNWLRGVASKELRFTGGIFRNRTTTVMGDIINSDPIFSYTDDYGYTSLPATVAGQSTYAAFLSGKSSRPPMVYDGANDGMLHAFRADTGDANSGKELFAYVPTAVYGNLSSLTETNYSHKYFVDGSPSIGDAYLSGWKTVLVGGLGKGGKAIYALDISNPSSFANSNVLWEYSGAAVDTGGTGTIDANGMGLTYSQPQIARLNDGTWAAIFGNGYNSISERAFLYIVNLGTGALIKKIPTNSTTSNGLSTPRLYDSNNDKTVDFVYAGDLQGNLWKFDISGTTSAGWGLGNSGNPLFIARNASNQIQPITAQPTVGGHPSGGVLVYFGTGSYLTATDVSDTTVESFYAIWDKPLSLVTVASSSLVQQTIIEEVVSGTAKTITGCVDDPLIAGNECLVTFNYDLRATSKNSVDYTSKLGWYMDLLPLSGVAAGERVISYALLKQDRVIFLTVIPSADPCVPGGNSWLMELDTSSGGATAASSFDFNNDNKFDDKDKLPSNNTASGLKSTVGMVKSPVWLEKEGTGTAVKVMSGTTSNITTIKNRGNPVPASGAVDRLYWLQIQ